MANKSNFIAVRSKLWIALRGQNIDMLDQFIESSDIVSDSLSNHKILKGGDFQLGLNGQVASVRVVLDSHDKS